MMVSSRKPNGIDVAALKQQAAGRWPELLTALGGVGAELLDGKNHSCPKCGGKDRFRLIDAGGRRLLLQPVFQSGQRRRHRGASVAPRRHVPGGPQRPG